MNNDRKEGCFSDNYVKLFGQRLPHLDTVETFLRQLPTTCLEELKATLVSALIEQKVLHKLRLMGKYFTVAIDGTGLSSYAENDAEGSRIHKTSKNGVVTCFHYVVEAKLVTPSGLAISLASEWVANEPGRNYDKQDCEQRAFERLAVKLKKYFPRLPVCILADGLYPNKTFMEICQKNDWAYLVVLKDGSLKTLQDDIADTENRHLRSLQSDHSEAKGKTHIHRQYQWIELPLDYSGQVAYWLGCTETVTHYGKDNKPLEKQDKPTRFVWLTNQKVTLDNIRQLAEAARNRWKIENEGFNTQKNGGYALGHKYSRKSFNSYKNYYQCLQIAHLINQLAVHSTTIADMLKDDAKLTIAHMYKQLKSWMTFTNTDTIEADNIEFDNHKRCQIRLR